MFSAINQASRHKVVPLDRSGACCLNQFHLPAEFHLPADWCKSPVCKPETTNRKERRKKEQKLSNCSKTTASSPCKGTTNQERSRTQKPKKKQHWKPNTQKKAGACKAKTTRLQWIKMSFSFLAVVGGVRSGCATRKMHLCRLCSHGITCVGFPSFLLVIDGTNGHQHEWLTTTTFVWQCQNSTNTRTLGELFFGLVTFSIFFRWCFLFRL